MAAGRNWKGGDFVFATPTGEPMVGTTLTHRFQRRLASAGLPRMRWHDMRHGRYLFFSLRGPGHGSCRRCSGNSTFTLTVNLFSHIVPDLMQDAADRMEQVFGAAR